MKKLFTILLILMTNLSMAFDYPEYVKNYLDTVKGKTVGSGVCIDLVEDMFKNIDDSMLVNVHKNAWGYPVNFDEVRTGDIITFNNHIAVIYVNDDGEVYLVDQNSSGNLDEVKFHPFNKRYSEFKNVQLFRPVELEEVELHYDGFSKKELLKLYTIHILDEDKMSRCVSEVTYSKYIYQYIIDTTLRYKPSELIFAKYFNGKVYCEENDCYINTTPGSILRVVKTPYMEWKPID